ncbi:MAG: phage protein [Phycisphaerales bacterium]|nr:phage protein [Phycisphaerales bacterium]
MTRPDTNNADSATDAPAVPAFGADDGLTPRQGRAVEALLREPSLTRAAAAAGVNERTLRRWAATPEFRAAVLRARRDAFGQAVGLTQRYAPVAVATLVRVMNDPGAGAGAKVTAASVLLRFGRDGVELDDLAARVEELERTAAAPRRAVPSRAVEPVEAADDSVDEDDGDADEPDDASDEDDADEPGGAGDDGGADDDGEDAP